MWWFAALVAAAVVPRLPSVAAGFAIDDPLLVERAASALDPASTLLDAWPPGVYRPVVTLHFDACQSIFGDWAPGYHLVSVGLHAAVVVLLFLLCARLVGTGRAALCAALAFALLPVLNEAIAWAASVGDLWAAGLILTAVLLALLATEKKQQTGLWFWLSSMAAFVLSCGAKETAVVAALLVPGAAWVFGRRRPTWGWTAAYPAVVIAYLFWYASRVPGPGIGLVLSGKPWRCLETTVQSLALIPVPFARNAVGDFLWSGRGWSGPLTVACLVALGVVVALAVRRGDRVAVFGWFWAVAAFLPVCRLPWGERYAYLPAVGLALVAAAVLAGTRKRKTNGANLIIVVILVVFAVGSVLSAAQWTVRVGRFTARVQNLNNIAAQWNPAPKAVRSTRSPGLIRP